MSTGEIHTTETRHWSFGVYEGHAISCLDIIRQVTNHQAICSFTPGRR